MATSTVQPSQSIPESSLANSRALALGMTWGGCMLFILGLWIGVKHEDLSRWVVFLIWGLGLIAFACGIWQFLALGRPAQTAAQKHDFLLHHGNILSLVMIAGGMILLALGLMLGIWFKLAAFGEAVGMCLLGLIAIGSGRNFYKKEASKSDSPALFDLLGRQHTRFGLVLLAFGILLGLTALGLMLIAKLGVDWFPEMAGLLALGIVGISGGIWLILSTSADLTTAKMRLFLLIMGGVAGLILSLGALVRAYLWRDEVFGGMRAWQGDTGWHLWVCAYVLLIGLALMFASLLFARTDVRSNVVLRRALYGYNAVLTGLLLLAMLVVLNIVLFAFFPFSFEWSKSRGAHTLSPSTKNSLNNLREPTTIYVLLPRAVLTTELKNFFENVQSQSTKVEIKYLDPLKDFEEFENLAKRFPDSLTGRVTQRGAVDRGILIVYGNLPADPAKKVPHAFVTTNRLVEQQSNPTREEGVKGVVVFKGESEVMSELSFLAEGRKKPKVYILQGNGELDINETQNNIRQSLRVELEPLGAGQLVDRLKKDQFDVQGLTFRQQLPKDKSTNVVFAKETGPEKRKEVPDDAEALLIAGPSLPFSPATLDALERYMDRGGKLLVYLDIVVDAKTNQIKTTGLEEFLRKYGVLVGADFGMRVPQDARDDPRVVFATVPKNTDNPLAKPYIGDEPLVMSSARVIRPDPAAQKYKPEIILQLDPQDRKLQQLYWVETAVRALANPMAYVKELAKEGVLQDRLSSEPIPMAVAVSEKLFVPGAGKESSKPRLVVFGDAEVISNVGILQGLEVGDMPYTWASSSLNWLTAKKISIVGPRTKTTTSYSINPITVNVDRMAFLPGWLMMLTILSLGAGIWVVRRR